MPAAIASSTTTTSTQLTGSDLLRRPRPACSARRARTSTRGPCAQVVPLRPHLVEVTHIGTVPGSRPPGQGEHPVHQARREAPDEQSSCGERGTHVPGWAGHAEPRRRIGERGDRHADHRGGLARVDDPHRHGPRPVREHRRHGEPGDRDRQRRQRHQGDDAVGIEAGLLVRLAQRGGDGPGVGGVDGPAGERGLARVRAHLGGALGEQQLGRVPRAGEQHEHCGTAPVRRRAGDAPPERHVVGPEAPARLDERGEPVGGGVGVGAGVDVGHPAPPRAASTAARTCSGVRSTWGGMSTTEPSARTSTLAGRIGGAPSFGPTTCAGSLTDG